MLISSHFIDCKAQVCACTGLRRHLSRCLLSSRVLVLIPVPILVFFLKELASSIDRAIKTGNQNSTKTPQAKHKQNRSIHFVRSIDFLAWLIDRDLLELIQILICNALIPTFDFWSSTMVIKHPAWICITYHHLPSSKLIYHTSSSMGI